MIGDKWEEYSRRIFAGESPRRTLDDLGINRYCCRRMFLSHVSLASEYLRYSSRGRSEK